MKLLNNLLLLISTTSIIFSSCKDELPIVSGNKIIISKEFKFDALVGADVFDYVDTVFFIQGSTQSVIVKADSNIVSRLTKEVVGNAWQVKFQPGAKYESYTMNIYITLPTLKRAYMEGKGIMNISSFVNQSELYLGLKGDGIVNVGQFDGATDVTVYLEGGGAINCPVFPNPYIENLHLETKGDQGEINCFNFVGENVTAKVTGLNLINTKAMKTLDVTINGDGAVYYKGSPTLTQDIKGYGIIVQE